MNQYLFNAEELPAEMKSRIKAEKRGIDVLVEQGRHKELSDLENELLSTWYHLKLRIDIVSQQRQSNTREQLLEARLSMTLYNEILLYIRDKNEESMLRTSNFMKAVTR